MMTIREKWGAKPCPLCNNTDIYITPKDIFTSVLKSKDCEGSLVSVECYKCGLELKLFGVTKKTDYISSIKKNVARWNKLCTEKEIDDDGK